MRNTRAHAHTNTRVRAHTYTKLHVQYTITTFTRRSTETKSD